MENKNQEILEQLAKLQMPCAELLERNDAPKRVYDDFEESVRREVRDFYESGCFFTQGVNEFGYWATNAQTAMASAMNRVLRTNEFTENRLLDAAIQDGLWDNGTTTEQVLELYEKMNGQCGGILRVGRYNEALSMRDMAALLDSGATLTVAVDANVLWGQPDPMGSPVPAMKPTNHWITVTGACRDENGKLIGFEIVDSDGGERYADADKFQAMCFGSNGGKLADPACIVVSSKYSNQSLQGHGENSEKRESSLATLLQASADGVQELPFARDELYEQFARCPEDSDEAFRLQRQIYQQNRTTAEAERCYVLTDPVRSGVVIKVEGRKHYRFSFGDYQWVRTTLFQEYLTQGTHVAGQFREVTQEQAQKLLVERGRILAALQQKAECIAVDAHQGQVDKAGAPYIDHPRAVADGVADWEEKIAAWLHDLCEDTSWTVEQLNEGGFPQWLCQAVELLTHPEGMSYGEYLARLRGNRIARNVKLSDLSHNMDLRRLPNPGPKDRERVEKYKKARKFLFGDISEFTDQVEREASRQRENSMPTAAQIYQTLYPLALGGRKIPHGLSNPVLRERGGKLCLAFFVYTYSRSDLTGQTMGRPVSWLTADIESGRLMEEIFCQQEDFSQAPQDGQYSTAHKNDSVNAQLRAQAYSLLDTIRQDYLETGDWSWEHYEQYFSWMLAAVPPEYHVFYRELSIGKAGV